MNNNGSREQAILSLVESARKQSDAIIVIGICAGDRIFYSVDERITIPDLHGILRRNVDFICESVAKYRARVAQERNRP